MLWTVWTWNPPLTLQGLLKETYFLCSHERLWCQSPVGECFLRLIMLTQSVFKGSTSLEPLAQLHLSATAAATAAARTHTSNFLSCQYSAALCFAILIFCSKAHQSFECVARTSLWLLELFLYLLFFFFCLKRAATNSKWKFLQTREQLIVSTDNEEIFVLNSFLLVPHWHYVESTAAHQWLISGWSDATLIYYLLLTLTFSSFFKSSIFLLCQPLMLNQDRVCDLKKTNKKYNFIHTKRLVEWQPTWEN